MGVPCVVVQVMSYFSKYAGHAGQPFIMSVMLANSILNAMCNLPLRLRTL